LVEFGGQLLLGLKSAVHKVEYSVDDDNWSVKNVVIVVRSEAVWESLRTMELCTLDVIGGGCTFHTLSVDCGVVVFFGIVFGNV
jgi:hypothetical protein